MYYYGIPSRTKSLQYKISSSLLLDGYWNFASWPQIYALYTVHLLYWLCTSEYLSSPPMRREMLMERSRKVGLLNLEVALQLHQVLHSTTKIQSVLPLFHASNYIGQGPHGHFQTLQSGHFFLDCSEFIKTCRSLTKPQNYILLRGFVSI